MVLVLSLGKLQGRQRDHNLAEWRSWLQLSEWITAGKRALSLAARNERTR